MRIRPTARVLVLDDRQRLLMFRIHDTRPIHPAYPEMVEYWITPGGGVEEDETHEQAARRELWEEAGITVDDVGPCVWHYERVIHGDVFSFHLQERFFLVTVPASAVSLANMLPYEQTTHLAYHWWTRDELLRSPDAFLPPALPRALQPLLDGHIPAAPLRLEER